LKSGNNDVKKEAGERKRGKRGEAEKRDLPRKYLSSYVKFK